MKRRVPAHSRATFELTVWQDSRRLFTIWMSETGPWAVQGYWPNGVPRGVEEAEAATVIAALDAARAASVAPNVPLPESDPDA